MTDTFMSGWGQAGGKTNKLVIVCNNWDEAEIVANNAKARTDTKYVSICINKPRYYPKDKYLVQFKTEDDYPYWFKPDYFKKQVPK